MTFFVETPKESLLGNKITSKGFAILEGPLQPLYILFQCITTPPYFYRIHLFVFL